MKRNKVEVESNLCWLFIYCIWISLIDASAGYKASFYGDSFINMPIQEAKISTNIRLKFKTGQENGLIFATAGRFDALTLSLQSGQLKLDLRIAEHHVELWSPKSLYFNDKLWHDVVIFRYETNITFQVNEHFMRETIPKKVGELNVNFGVFLGGLGDFSAPSILDYEYFRGCLSDVYYNNISVLKRAKESTTHMTVEKVTWGTCSTEFDATENDDISFLYDGSYAMLRLSDILSTEHNWSFDFKTTQRYAPLLISWSKTDLFAVEILDSKVRIVVGRGDVQATEIVAQKNISDGQWHNLQLQRTVEKLKLTLDGMTEQKSMNSSERENYQNKEFYIGGIPERSRKRALSRGVKGVETSIKGCMKNLRVNGQIKGFPDFKATEGLASECLWIYPCIEKSPCIPSSSCHQQKTNKFICYCDQLYCIRADYREPYSIFSRDFLPTEIEVAQIDPVVVLEGESTYITSSHIFVTLDYMYEKLQDQAIVFNIIQPPKHGVVRKILDSGDLHRAHNFTYRDILGNKVKYIHDGDEEHTDQIIINLAFHYDKKKKIDELFMSSYRFILHFNITPVNDAPLISVPKNTILRAVQGIPKLFSTDYVHLNDPDSAAESLIYKVILSKKPDNFTSSFVVENEPVETFSQSDVLDQKVWFKVNEKVTEEKRFEIYLEVSDGIKTSPIVSLTVNVVPLELRMVNNTGLSLVHQNSALISHFNLSFTANAENHNLIVKYKIIHPPEYGAIQKMRIVDGNWSAVNSFTSEQLLLGQIRYAHLYGTPAQDEFKFTASLESVVTQIFDFRIKFYKFQVVPINQKNVLIKGVREINISSNSLLYQTLHQETLPTDIIYTIESTPKYGILVSGKQLQVGSVFTQADINADIVMYRMYHTTFSNFNDTFEFSVSALRGDGAFNGSLLLEFVADEDTSKLVEEQTFEKIQVLEGGRSTISRINFPITFSAFHFLMFNVTDPPQHGFICRYSNNFQTQIVKSFTLGNLQSGDIYYCHDNSESEKDDFKLLIYSREKFDFQYVAQLFVEISLINDNEPKQLINKTVFVVKKRQIIISRDILNYTDDDINTSPADIKFQHVIASNGDVYLLSRPTNSFTQHDVNEDLVYFEHKGPDIGNITFTVSDGLHETRGVLAVEASDPFIKIMDVKDVLLKERGSLPINQSIINLDINFNVRPTDVKYDVIMEPSFGILGLVNSSLTMYTMNVLSFTHEDVINNNLMYTNQNLTSHDSIRLRAKCNGLRTEADVTFRIYPESYWKELFVKHNETVFVEESKSCVITRQNLEVNHQSITDPKEITYIVRNKPVCGYLQLDSVILDKNEFKMFDQQSINDGKLSYIQTCVNGSSDFFVVDITNGIMWMRQSYIQIVIVPSLILIDTKPVRVKKGSATLLSPDYILPRSDYYKHQIIEYKIIEGPRYGSIRLREGNVRTIRFTQNQLNSKLVEYAHNGHSEKTDVIKIIAISPNKDSEVFSMKFIVFSSEEEGPRVVKNKATACSYKGKAVIRRTHLRTVNKDTTDDRIIYIVKSIYGGQLVSENIGKESIRSFSQADINDAVINFLHTEDNTNPKFTFYVTDGFYNSSEENHNFIIDTGKILNYKNVVLRMLPKVRVKLTKDFLLTEFSQQDMPIVYKLTKLPKLGRLRYQATDDRFVAITDTFSQSDIDNGRIFYENTHSIEKPAVNDSFQFNINLPGNIIQGETFYIEISVLKEFSNLIKIETVRVEEGGSVPIKLDFSAAVDLLRNRMPINPQSIVIERHDVSHGEIKISDGRVSTTVLNVEDFHQNRVIYVHDHSDSTEDELLLSVFLLQGNTHLCDIKVPISITPINDQPCHLRTQLPQITVVNGENFTITNEVLLTQDTDTPSTRIEYEVLSPPSFGSLVKIVDTDTVENLNKLGNKFTQNDISQGRICYFHRGPSKSTSFNFKVSDGKFDPIHAVVNIKVAPVHLSCDLASKTAEIIQGTSTVQLTFENLVADTNVNKFRLWYNIVEKPVHGLILENNRSVAHFTYNGLQQGQIVYALQNNTVNEDSFKSLISVKQSEVTCSVVTQIRIKPFININSISITGSERRRLSVTFEKVSPFFRNPMAASFTLKPTLTYGTVIRVEKGDPETFIPVNSFTFKDIDNGLIHYEPKDIERTVEELVDEIHYMVRVNGSLQVGHGTAYVYLLNQRLNVSSEVESHEINSATFYNYTIIILAILFFLILITIIILIIRYLTCDNDKHKLEKDMPPPLPMPPDFVLNNSPLYVTYSNAGSLLDGSMPVISNLPNCKIIPMETDSTYRESGLEDFVNFEEEEEEDDMVKEWDSFRGSASEMNQNSNNQYSTIYNPLLRRNQYWV